MDNYIWIIKIALLVFPIVALLISVPFILIEYHKYGSISFLRGLIIYSFVLYFICIYFLIILPLPKISVVEALTTPRMQLIPFSFIYDFIKNTSFNIADVHTYIKAIKETYFFVPIYNIFLTLPFGIYLRYFYKCNFKKTILYSFLLSLFFELTQLSGLYFIYPRGYRLFDVDDLILNTLGGIVGYFIAKPIIKVLPTREKIDEEAKERGKKITGFKRSTSFAFDLFIVFSLEIIISFFMKANFTLGYIFILLVYYFILPLFLKGRTVAQSFLNIKVKDNKGKRDLLKFYLREIVFILLYIGIPSALYFYMESKSVNTDMEEFIGVILIFIIFIIDVITGIKYFFTNKQMYFEKITKSKLVSTIK